jgi:hypothetical protein
MKNIELRDQHAAIEVKVEDEELVHIALNGFHSSCDVFVRGFCLGLLPPHA